MKKNNFKYGLMLFAGLTLQITSYAQAPMPPADTVIRNAMTQILRENNFDKKAELFASFTQQSSSDTSTETKRNTDRLYSIMCRAAMMNGRIKEFDAYVPHVTSSISATYFEFAQKLVKDQRQPADAERYAGKAYNELIADKSMLAKKENTPDSIYREQVNRRNFIVAKYADVYAQACFLNGNYATGLTHAKKAAIVLSDEKNREYNSTYALLVAKALPVAKAKKEVERLAMNGALTEKGKAALKDVYIREHHNEKGFETYAAKLENIAANKGKEELKKVMIKKTAPAFDLINTKGEKVSLATLKGKVIVVDFWATWCVPCIASFPAVHATMEKFKNNPDVVFLFIDTKETVSGDERAKRIEKVFSREENKKFASIFNIPLDNEDTTAKKFGVISIPAKFVIDKKGNIRFATAGFNGKIDDLVTELSLMITMAAEAN